MVTNAEWAARWGDLGWFDWLIRIAALCVRLEAPLERDLALCGPLTETEGRVPSLQEQRQHTGCPVTLFQLPTGHSVTVFQASTLVLWWLE